MVHTLKHYLILLLPALFIPTAIAQTGAPGDILEQTARELKRAGGVQAKFALTVIKDGAVANVTDGTLWLKDEKFLLETDEMTTWFDGTTQWTYVPEHEEVNVGKPTEEELQSINPYALLTSYKKGYTLKKGNTAT